MSCCEQGYGLGFRTFVLQGGEDAYFTDERVCDIVSKIKEAYPDCAVTLSIGEKSRESYQAFFDAGADRYLLRHRLYRRSLQFPSERHEHGARAYRRVEHFGKTAL